MGCVMGQHDESGKREKAIYYLSKKFTEYEARYSSIEKFCCALVWAARRLRQYMLYHTTWLISKLDPIKYMMESPALSRRMARWQILLSEYDITYECNNRLFGNSKDRGTRAIKIGLPRRRLDLWKLSFDGASNALGHGIGAVLVSPEGNHYPFTARLNFFCTNNIAEYEACIMGLRAAIERDIKILKVSGDSALVIYQIRGYWEVRDSKLVKYHNLVVELVREFEEVTFNYFPREENQLADALATLASMFKANREAEIMPLQMSIYEGPAHCFSIEKEADGQPWFHDILEYVKNQGYPGQANENDKRTIRRMAAGFVLDGDILYKKGKDQVLLRCVDNSEARKILEEVHEGICGTHANGFTMARKIMRLGYYWLTMESDCIRYARKCHKCQIYGDKIHAAPSPLHVMTSPWPFSIWGMDVIEPIFPKASNGHRFIFVVIDYFTKWVEAASFANVTKNAVCKFLKKEIIC
ncbi:RNA-directed DNA polymerase (Reverse transcriptase), Ribonuclease H [Gossypium australe]|uniref:RNA-directed DNA polymerase (Reverse transcriptase), Ribonuclease H n=1 Tax=Gossypium australe TaxID=47621 RepID=A0A5B6WSD6_9ROSI|nr:RNA-directed DNA polymerase (Reverse transcriptase), Ribonuclease H [Gossypium australe]